MNKSRILSLFEEIKYFKDLGDKAITALYKKKDLNIELEYYVDDVEFYFGLEHSIFYNLGDKVSFTSCTPIKIESISNVCKPLEFYRLNFTIVRVCKLNEFKNAYLSNRKVQLLKKFSLLRDIIRRYYFDYPIERIDLLRIIADNCYEISKHHIMHQTIHSSQIITSILEMIEELKFFVPKNEFNFFPKLTETLKLTKVEIFTENFTTKTNINLKSEYLPNIKNFHKAAINGLFDIYTPLESTISFLTGNIPANKINLICKKKNTISTLMDIMNKKGIIEQTGQPYRYLNRIFTINGNSIDLSFTKKNEPSDSDKTREDISNKYIIHLTKKNDIMS